MTTPGHAEGLRAGSGLGPVIPTQHCLCPSDGVGGGVPHDSLLGADCGPLHPADVTVLQARGTVGTEGSFEPRTQEGSPLVTSCEAEGK